MYGGLSRIRRGQRGRRDKLAPRGALLFNPVLSFVPEDPAKFDRRVQGFSKRLGAEPQQLSPAHHVGADAPPTLVLVGTNDYVREGIAQFDASMEAADRRCEVKWYEGRNHGFFNTKRGREDFLATVRDMDRFLRSLNYLEVRSTPTNSFGMLNSAKAMFAPSAQRRSNRINL